VPSQLAQAVTRAAYGARQLTRVAWYVGHSLMLRELANAARQREKPKARRRVHTNAPMPDRQHIYADMAKLFLKDLANVEAGLYPVRARRPRRIAPGVDPSLTNVFRRSS
jgi:hypothetical protein